MGEHVLFCDATSDVNAVESLLAKIKEDSEELTGLEPDDVLVRPLVNGPVHSHSGTVIVQYGLREAHRLRVDASDESSAGCPLVHASVFDRFRGVPDYRPSSIRGLRFELWNDERRKRRWL